MGRVCVRTMKKPCFRLPKSAECVTMYDSIAERKENRMQDKDQHSTEEQLAHVEDENLSAFENARMIEARARREAELAERARQAKENEAAYQAREEYAKELYDERIDLMRLKQGVITDSDKVFPEQAPEKKYTISEKIGNWLYHSKWWLGIAVFCVALGGFLIYDYVTKVEADVNLLLISNDYEIYGKSELLCDMMEKNLADYNDDDRSVASVVFVPVSKSSMETGSFSTSYNTQLLVQMQSDMCMLVIGDTESDSYIEAEKVYAEIETLYPQYDFIDNDRILLKDTYFQEWLGYESELREGAYLALRLPTAGMSTQEEMQEAYDEALPVLEVLMEQLATKPPVTESTTGGE